MKVKTLIFLVALASVASSCSKKVYFNNQMRGNLEVAAIPLTGLQFYNDQKIVLKRKLKSESTKVQSGTVQLKDGEYIHFLILKKKTPGVCKELSKNELSIAFEQGEGKLLKFKHIKRKDLSRGYELVLNASKSKAASPKVFYNGKEYFIHQGEDAKLMVKRDDISKVKVKKQRMKGVKIK